MKPELLWVDNKKTVYCSQIIAVTEKTRNI